jgi:hypothetical protein
LDEYIESKSDIILIEMSAQVKNSDIRTNGRKVEVNEKTAMNKIKPTESPLATTRDKDKNGLCSRLYVRTNMIASILSTPNISHEAFQLMDDIPACTQIIFISLPQPEFVPPNPSLPQLDQFPKYFAYQNRSILTFPELFSNATVPSVACNNYRVAMPWGA